MGPTTPTSTHCSRRTASGRSRRSSSTSTASDRSAKCPALLGSAGHFRAIGRLAAKRIIVHESIRGDLVDAMTPLVRALTVGDPMIETTDVGPLARFDLLSTLQEQRRRSLEQGGVVLAEAAAPDGAGAWFAPALVSVSNADSILLTDVTFGPLGAVTSGWSDEDLLTIANRSRFGLSSSVWSSDPDRAESLSAGIVAGSVFITTISATDPRLPTGGVKASGYGRELGHWGLSELANVQSVRVHRP